MVLVKPGCLNLTLSLNKFYKTLLADEKTAGVLAGTSPMGALKQYFIPFE